MNKVKVEVKFVVLSSLLCLHWEECSFVFTCFCWHKFLSSLIFFEAKRFSLPHHTWKNKLILLTHCGETYFVQKKVTWGPLHRGFVQLRSLELCLNSPYLSWRIQEKSFCLCSQEEIWVRSRVLVLCTENCPELDTSWHLTSQNKERTIWHSGFSRQQWGSNNNIF